MPPNPSKLGTNKTVKARLRSWLEPFFRQKPWKRFKLPSKEEDLGGSAGAGGRVDGRQERPGRRELLQKGRIFADKLERQRGVPAGDGRCEDLVWGSGFRVRIWLGFRVRV